MLVIFDCDGVLVETEKLSAGVLQSCLRERGIHMSSEAILRDFRGKAIATCVAQVKTLLAANALEAADQTREAEDFWRRVQARTLEAFDSGVEQVPGVEAVLQRLQTAGVAFVVASNGKHEKMRKTLGVTGLLPLFEGRMFSATDVAAGKPAPDLFLLAAARMGVSPGDCVVVEDSPVGARAARAAGMSLVGYCPLHDPETEVTMREQGARIIRHMDALWPVLCKYGGQDVTAAEVPK